MNHSRMENTTSDNGNHGIPIVKTEEIGYSYDSEDTGPINDHRQQINHTLDIPEARGLVWDDCFYDSMEGVIAVFDVNRDDFVSATFRANMTRLVSALFRGIGLGGIVFVKMIVAPLWLALLVALPVTLFYVIYFWSGFSRDFKEMEGFYHIAVFKNAIRLDCEGFPSSTTLVCHYGYHNHHSFPFDRLTHSAIICLGGKDSIPRHSSCTFSQLLRERLCDYRLSLRRISSSSRDS